MIDKPILKSMTSRKQITPAILLLVLLGGFWSWEIISSSRASHKKQTRAYARLMVAVSGSAIAEYQDAHGAFPAPENGRLPSVLSSPRNFLRVNAPALGRDVFLDRLPVDPYEKSERSNPLRAPLEQGTLWVERQGPPLRYYVHEKTVVANNMHQPAAVTMSNGPDCDIDYVPSDEQGIDLDRISLARYDASNGTMSGGDFIRVLFLNRGTE